MDVDESRLEAIRSNAAFVVEQLSGVADFTLGYDRDSVAWVEGFIERRRASDDAEMHGKLISVLGSFLGEAIIANAGGSWADVEGHGLGVRLANDQCCFPFTKVEKQFEQGLAAGESILSFYNVCVNYLATGALDGPAGATGSTI